MWDSLMQEIYIVGKIKLWIKISTYLHSWTCIPMQVAVPDQLGPRKEQFNREKKTPPAEQFVII